MSLYRVVYASKPADFNDKVRNGILDDSRRWNTQEGLTGILMCRDDLFMQWLEGPEAAVRAAFVRIQKDRRHYDIRPLLLGTLGNRLFPAWAMRYDPVPSWMWSPRDIADGAIERTDEIDIMAIFSRIAAEAS